MTIEIKRVYEAPAPDDGYRVLVDRLWPRGLTRDAVRLDEWARELAPSTDLRKWFGHDPARWPEFRTRYLAELRSGGAPAKLAELVARSRSGRVTLLYAARDVTHNEARVLAEELAEDARHDIGRTADAVHR